MRFYRIRSRQDHESVGLKTKANILLDVNFNSSWTNATFADALCGGITKLGATLVTQVSIGDGSDPREYGPPFLIPDCFWTLSVATEISVENSIFMGSTSGEADPLLRLPATVVSLKLFNCILTNPSAPGNTYKPNWNALFASKPLLKTLSLYNARLEANLPSLIPASLTSLSLSYNPKLTGSIPSDLFSNYPSAAIDNIFLDVSNNGLTGTIPTALFINLKAKPRNLNFGYNALNGAIPSKLFEGVEWSAPNVAISFAGNRLTGALPSDVFGRHFWGTAETSLNSASLDLSNNQLSGTIPATLFTDGSEVSSLFLDLSGNGFTGPIPDFFANVNDSHLFESLNIRLANNQLSGALSPNRIWPPTFLETVTLAWNLTGNGISGTIPTTLFEAADPRLSSITLDLSSNAFTGAIQPSTIANARFNNPITLRLSFADNGITGPLTADLVGSGSLIATNFFLDLSSNPFGGTIPSNLISSYTGAASSRNTTYLTLSLNDCGLSGTLPAISATLQGLSLFFERNALSAIPTSSWSTYLTTTLQSVQSTVTLSVALNNFTGELYLPNFGSVHPRLNFNGYGNKFSSFIVGASSSYLYYLNLGMNRQMTGTIPRSFLDESASLYYFYANFTALSGDFPNLSGVVSGGIGELDLSNTSVNFCPVSLTAPWTAHLDLCELQSDNIAPCLNLYPLKCQFSYGRHQTAPQTPAVPSASPSSPQGPSSPSSTPIGAAPSVSPTTSSLALVTMLVVLAVW